MTDPISLCLALAMQAAPVSIPHDEHEGCSHAKLALARLARHAPPPGGPDALEDTDVTHYFLDVEIDPVAKTVGGTVTMSVKSLVSALGVFQFRLHEILPISAVSVNGAPTTWKKIDSTTWEATLDKSYGVGETFDLAVTYAGKPASLGFGSIIFSSQGGMPAVWTLSETDFAYTWFPVKVDNRDKATADLWFTVPDTLVVGSNGLLTGTDVPAAGKKRYKWKTNYPTDHYLFSFGATNYDVVERVWNYPGQSMPVMYFFYPGTSLADRQQWYKCEDMLTAFSDAVSLYPFVQEKYGMLCFGWGGGMEHQTLTSQGTFAEWITAHELGHQWWGDMVTCATWHDIWLNEGFATYMEAIWFENKAGSGGVPTMLSYMNNNKMPGSLDGSVYVYDITNFGAIFSTDFVYRKGGWVLLMLRKVLGDEKFFETLKQYRGAFEYGAALTSDFQAIAESVHGADLDWFFDPWVYQKGAPNYRYASKTHAIGGKTYVEVMLQQVQQQVNSPEWPIYTMPLDVRATIGGKSQNFIVWNDAAKEHLLFEAPGAPTALALDPDGWTLVAGKTTTAFAEGPPKIITLNPPDGFAGPGGQAAPLAVQFHKDVTAAAGHFALKGAIFDDIPFTLAYDPNTFTATLTPAGVLKPDSYTLAISDEIVDVAAGLKLDGELVAPFKAAGLPSGDGLPGGAALVSFQTGPQGDLNGDGKVDQQDLGILLNAWNASALGDLDGDDDTDQADLGILLANYGG